MCVCGGDRKKTLDPPVPRLGTETCRLVPAGPVATLIFVRPSSPLLDPTLGSFFLPLGTHPVLLLRRSVKLDGTQTTPSSGPRSKRETLGEPKAPSSHGLPWPCMPDFAGLSVCEPPPHSRHHAWTPDDRPFSPRIPLRPLRESPCPMRPRSGFHPNHSGPPSHLDVSPSYDSWALDTQSPTRPRKPPLPPKLGRPAEVPSWTGTWLH